MYVRISKVRAYPRFEHAQVGPSLSSKLFSQILSKTIYLSEKSPKSSPFVNIGIDKAKNESFKDAINDKINCSAV